MFANNEGTPPAALRSERCPRQTASGNLEIRKFPEFINLKQNNVANLDFIKEIIQGFRDVIKRSIVFDDLDNFRYEFRRERIVVHLPLVLWNLQHSYLERSRSNTQYVRYCS